MFQTCIWQIILSPGGSMKSVLRVIWRQRWCFAWNWGEEMVFFFFFSSFYSFALFKIPLLLNHVLGMLLYLFIFVSQCLELMDVFLNKTNLCFVVVFLQNSEHQQQEIKSLQLLGSVMGATGTTCVAIRMVLENETGYREKISSISSSSVSCQIWSN